MVIRAEKIRGPESVSEEIVAEGKNVLNPEVVEVTLERGMKKFARTAEFIGYGPNEGGEVHFRKSGVDPYIILPGEEVVIEQKASPTQFHGGYNVGFKVTGS